uniref:Transposase Tc1-like domain-containing protein n=1 Tax=Oncorhynchus tshawytscha TaxID=74940 RepID=A0AAZ3Q378_ONCTS
RQRIPVKRGGPCGGGPSPCSLTPYFGVKRANQSQNNSKGPCEDAGGNRYKVYISTVKRVLYRHNVKGRSARKKPLLQNRHKKARLWFATAHGDKDHTFWRNVLWSDETKI